MISRHNHVSNLTGYGEEQWLGHKCSRKVDPLEAPRVEENVAILLYSSLSLKVTFHILHPAEIVNILGNFRDTHQTSVRPDVRRTVTKLQSYVYGGPVGRPKSFPPSHGHVVGVYGIRSCE